jgi:hypothetical protein
MDRVKETRPLVDASLIQEMLRLSPEERLLQNDRTIATIEELRRAFAARQPDAPARPPRR